MHIVLAPAPRSLSCSTASKRTGLAALQQSGRLDPAQPAARAMAQRRSKTSAISNPFSRFVLTELRRDLRSQKARNREFTTRHNCYWPQKEADFARIAEEVLAERKQSYASVEYIAAYLFCGLPEEKRAIEILLAAHEWEPRRVGPVATRRLSTPQQRYAESIPLLLPLVELRPENLSYRTKLMHAYFRTGKQAEAPCTAQSRPTLLPREGSLE